MASTASPAWRRLQSTSRPRLPSPLPGPPLLAKECRRKQGKKDEDRSPRPEAAQPVLYDVPGVDKIYANIPPPPP